MSYPLHREDIPRFRSKVHAYGHFVWTTKQRTPLITPDIERDIYRLITSEAEKMKCIVLALGGMPDHVHLVLRLPGMLSPAEAMKRIKSLSSAAFNDLRPEFSADGSPFHWQPGYGFFSLGQSEEERHRVISYVRHQKQHHANNDLWPEWETDSEEC